MTAVAKAMILAAGVDSHLSPLTLFMPKPIVPIVNKPVMEHVIELLARHGIKEIIATLHNRPDLIEQHFGDGRRWGVHITYSLERELMGAAGAVRRVAHHFDDTFLVMMGDAITDLDLGTVIAFHHKQGARATIALHRVEDPSQSVSALLDQNARILQLHHDPRPEEAVSNLVTMGVYVLEPTVLGRIPPGETYDLERQLFPRLLEEGVPVYGYEADCYWSDVGSFDAYRRAQRAILREQIHDVRIPGRQVTKGIWEGRNAAISPKARLVPPVVIGDNCQVRPDAIIGPETVLGRNVVVDEGATVKGSTVLSGTYVGRLVNVEEAVVNRNCLISIPASASVFVADRFLLGEVEERPLERRLGRALELLAALLLLLVSLPLWPLAALLARLTGPGSLLVREPRATADPETVRQTGHPGWRTVHIRRFRATPDTRAGGLLRRLGLQGLPGLLDVLRGDLALIGVGPLTPGQAEELTEDWQRQRFLHPAGLMGLWYTTEDTDSSLQAQLITDSYYAATRTWRHDVRILWRMPGVWWRQLWRT